MNSSHKETTVHDSDKKQNLIDAGRYLFDNRLAWGTSGNLSLRSDDGQMLITASGTRIGALSQNDFVMFHISSGEKLGNMKASKETPMHLGIYRNRNEVKAILHSSPFYSTLFSCCNEPVPSKIFVEAMYYLENISYVDYYHPGTQELADAISEQAKNADIIIMRHHGVVVMDSTLQEALVRMETLEIACRMALEAKKAGLKLNEIPCNVVKSFLEDSGYRPRKLFPQK